MSKKKRLCRCLRLLLGDRMAPIFNSRGNVVAGVIVVCIVFLVFLQMSPQASNTQIIVIPEETFRDATVGNAWKCPTVVNMTVGIIPSVLKTWSASDFPECRKTERLFRQIFEVTPRRASVRFPESMMGKLRGWLNDDPALIKMATNQTVVYIMNKWTFEGSIFNLLRQKRPKKATKGLGISDREYVDQLVRENAPSCDFCNYTKYTAADGFGRIESKLSYTSSNVFKLEAWHSLVIFRSHHPLVWSYEEFADTFQTARQWFQRVYEISPQHVYPMIFWDMMGHAGGSQVHPHYHPFVAADGYYGYFRKWQQTAAQYHRASGRRNYFADLVEVHDKIGLALKLGSAVALAHLTPRKDYEVVILAPELNEDFVKLAYFVIRGYIEDLGKYCFSFGIALPTLDRQTAGLPVIGRIISRGSVSSVHSDVSSMEIFAASLVDTDPFKVIKMLRDSVQKRMRETEGLKSPGGQKSSKKPQQSKPQTS